MSLTPGTRLGAYAITAQIGEGGMGEVYRATDTNLKRQVAIKVLPASVAGDADRLARFQREAEVLAALNHPNIAGIYGLERTPDVTALVMELVEGDDLSQRIKKGAIPVDEALPIAKQIAEALEAAHEQGIIHRDLKPANIRVRADGTVKVLDFGLAKALQDPKTSHLRQGSGGQAGPQDLVNSPTITSPAHLRQGYGAAGTEAGMILGTAAYMAPEQARGKVVDRRADIWAFGAVLFEMLSARRPFDGEDMTEVLGGVVRLEPQWDALPPAVPPMVSQALRLCLRKDPKQRVGDIRDVRLVLEGAFETAAPQATPLAGSAPQSVVARALPWALAGTFGVALITALTLWAPLRSPPVPAPRKLIASDRAKAGTFNLYRVNADGTGEVTRLTESPETQRPYSWHPGGKFLAFRATRPGTGNDLLILPMEGDATRGWTPGTPTAFLNTPANESSPMFSPDGRWIAYNSDETGSFDVWSPTSIQLPGDVGSPYDLHPDGTRVATSAAPEQASSVQDKVVFVVNFADYLRTIAPGNK